MRVISLKGMNDILPSEAHVWQDIERKAREIFSAYGYAEIRTPVLEETGLFKRSIGEATDIVNKEMYSFRDKGGRDITLRPEGTAPIVRAYLEHNMTSDDAVRLYYIGPMFRSERPQKGRTRQFHQIGAEYIGASSPYADAEVIYLMSQFYKKLGLAGAVIKLSSLGCRDDKKAFAKKLHRYLEPERKRLCDDCQNRLDKNVLRTMDCKVEGCRAVLREAPRAKDFLCASCEGHYRAVKEILSGLKVDFKEDFDIVRGLDYYTNTVFEVSHPGLGSQDALAAGGRYDDLIADFGGKKTAAFGFALGIERLIMALEQEGKLPKEKFAAALYIAATSEDVRKKAFETAIALRNTGVPCEICLKEKSLKAQLRQADRKQARFTAIFGDEELKRGEVILRDMGTSAQKNIPLDKLGQALKEALDV